MSKSYVPTDLRRLVRERANGCCEYCGISESFVFATHEIEHVIAEKHRGETTSENLAYSCAICNKQKGSDLASIDEETGETVRLFHPRKDVWVEHFQMDKSGRIQPRTSIGRVTIWLLKINRHPRIDERELLIRAGEFRERFRS